MCGVGKRKRPDFLKFLKNKSAMLQMCDVKVTNQWRAELKYNPGWIEEEDAYPYTAAYWSDSMRLT